MARFVWTPPGASSTVPLELPRRMMFRGGELARGRARYSSLGLDGRTRVTEVMGTTGTDAVVGRIRFINEPGLLAAMLEDAADGALLTYEHSNGVGFADLQLEGAGQVTPVFPDENRFGYNEWERILRLAHVGESANELLAPESEDDPEDFSTWTRSSVTVTTDVAAAPDGTPTADRITVSSNDADALVRRTPQFQDSPDIVALSVFLKDGNIGDDETAIEINDQGGSQGQHRITCGLASGATSVDTGSLDAHGGLNVGGGWWRFFLVKDISAFTGNVRFTIYPNRQATNSGDSLLAWGAQAQPLADSWVSGDAVPAYIPNSRRVLWQLFGVPA